MNVIYDKIADAIYMKVTNAPITETVKISDTNFVDKDAQGNIVGFEILDASSQQDLVKTLKGNVLGGIPVEITSSTPVLA